MRLWLVAARYEGVLLKMVAETKIFADIPIRNRAALRYRPGISIVRPHALCFWPVLSWNMETTFLFSGEGHRRYSSSNRGACRIIKFTSFSARSMMGLESSDWARVRR